MVFARTRLTNLNIITIRYLLGLWKMSLRHFLLLVALLVTIPSFSQVCMQYHKMYYIDMIILYMLSFHDNYFAFSNKYDDSPALALGHINVKGICSWS